MMIRKTKDGKWEITTFCGKCCDYVVICPSAQEDKNGITRFTLKCNGHDIIEEVASHFLSGD